MKKLLIVILALAVAVGGYFVVNINWGALFESSSTLTEAEARSLVVEKVGGEIVSISYNDSATPYYVVEVKNGEETIVVEVDAISSRITTKQVARGEADDANEPELPLTKERAIELAQEAFDGELVNVLLVERDGSQFYEIELQSDSEQAVLTYNVATGEQVGNEIAELNNVQTVASLIKSGAGSSDKGDSTSSSKNNVVTSGNGGSASSNAGGASSEASDMSSEKTVEKPTINKTEAPLTSALTKDQAEQIALRKVNGDIKSSKVVSESVYEFEINQNGKLFVVNIDSTNGLKIKTTSK